jgi:predicted DCC family thiol-disulfide oxidoreductase YuxK
MMNPPTLLYDRDCGVCKWVMGRVLRRDQNLDLSAVAIQSPEGERLLEPVPRARRLESWHLVLSDGRLYSGGDVFAPLLRLLRRPGQAWLLERIPALTSIGYRVAARRRSLVGSFVSKSAKARADEIIAEHAPAAEIGLPEVSDELPPVRSPAGAPAPAAPPGPVPAPPPAPVAAPAPAPARDAPAAPVAAPVPVLSSSAPDAYPDPPARPDREPHGWQQQFEESAFGRGILSTLIVVSLIAIVAINLPGSELRRQLLRPGQPYLNALGIDQNWSLFAPNPRRVVLDVSATVVYDDGRTAQWTFPHDGALLGTYRDYRWRKWQENLISPVNAAPLWRPAALWVASHETRVGHAVTRVTLVERYASLEPPGVTPSTGPAAIRVFFTLRLRGTGGAA